MRPPTLKSCFVLAIVAGGIVHAAVAQCRYEVTAIIQAPFCPPPLDHAQATTGLALNEAMMVAGHYQTCYVGPMRSFIWTPEDGFADLPLDPPFFESTALAVNNLGHVAGTFNPSAAGVPSSQWSFCWDGQEFRVIPPMGGLGVAAAKGINDLGAVVGTMTHPESGVLEAFVWQDGKTAIIGPFEIERSRVRDINNLGQVVGYMGAADPLNATARGFIWQDGEVFVLPPIPGGLTSICSAVNDLGQVVGGGLVQDADGALQTHAMLWQPDAMIDLGIVGPYSKSAATDINNFGQVVGVCQATADCGTCKTAFLWQDGEMLALEDLVDEQVFGTLTQALAINDHGQILCEGHIYSVILTPILTSATDLDYDCRTDLDDLLILIGQWGPGDGAADYDEDGTVGISDLIALLLNWG